MSTKMTDKKSVTMTTAYRQNNYLILENQPNSVTVSVYFRMGNKQILKPKMKSKLRSLKNSVHKYDEGQILVREITSDTNSLPKRSQLTALVHYLLKNEGLMDINTFKVLWKRLTDWQTLRHVEKSLLLIQHLLKQKHPFYSYTFDKYCKERKPDLIKLQNYYYKIDGSDIGQNVRQRAEDIFQTLFKPSNISTNETKTPEKTDVIDTEKVCENVLTVLPTTPIPLPRPKKPSKPKKHSKKRKKNKPKKEVRAVREEQDLLSLNVSNFQVSNGNNNGHCNNNNSSDIFDIFGELPTNVQSNDNGFQDFLSSNTTQGPGMNVSDNNEGGNATVDYKFPVTF